jgi:hypothetical protein
MSYAQGVVGFHLGSSHDAAEAWYSLDDRPPQPWRNDYPVLVAHRVSLEGGSLANPTGGVVLVPEGKLVDVRTVTIRAKADSTPKRFQLKGFQQALSAARLNGCTSFERDPW